MNTKQIGNMVGTALAYNDRIKVAQDVWAAEDALADYLESVEKNLNDEEFFYFDQIFDTMKKLNDAVHEFVEEAWEGIMYQGKGKLHLFENGHVGSKHDVDAQGTESLYSITLDWVDWKHAAIANEDGSKDFSVENDFKSELEKYLYNIVLNDYVEQWLEHIEDMYTRP